ncbi:hypothetical protein [Acinetobacter sp.]|uniref:hypothetical protein n=1 Tax=Acinetobacter sp. TaxID=472 RepID=UPI0035AF55AB
MSVAECGILLSRAAILAAYFTAAHASLNTLNCINRTIGFLFSGAKLHAGLHRAASGAPGLAWKILRRGFRRRRCTHFVINSTEKYPNLVSLFFIHPVHAVYSPVLLFTGKIT